MLLNIPLDKRILKTHSFRFLVNKKCIRYKFFILMTNPGKAEGNTSLTIPIYRFARPGEKRKCLPPSLSLIHKFVSGHLNPIHYSDCIKSWDQKLWRAKRQIGCELALGPQVTSSTPMGAPHQIGSAVAIGIQPTAAVKKNVLL